MEMVKAAKLTLRYLFSEYKKGPAVLYPISDFAKKNGADATLMSDYMLERAWIRERWIYSGNVVACRITISGITEIEPAYVRTKIDQIIGALADAGNSMALLKILELNIGEFSIASDFVNELERLQLVEITNPDNSVWVKLTEKGWKYHEKKNGGFLTLVA